MKTKLIAMLTAKVPHLLFVLACLLLIAVAVGAKLMADDAGYVMDNAMQRLSAPMPSLL